MQENPRNVIQALEHARRTQNVTYSELAKRLGSQNPNAAKLALDPSRKQPLGTVARIARALGVDTRIELSQGRTTFITFYNFAGGAAKTSSVRDVGYQLKELGFKVLLVDTDPQANLSAWLGVELSPKDPRSLAHTIWPGIFGINGNPMEDPSSYTLPEPQKTTHGLHLIPSVITLSAIDRILPTADNGTLRLRNVLRKLQGYDFVLIDTPPSQASITSLALNASDYVVVPVETNEKGASGIAGVIHAINSHRVSNPSLTLLMLLRTRANPVMRAARDISQELGENAPVPVGIPLVERPAVYETAVQLRAPIPALPNQKRYDDAKTEVWQVTLELLDTLGATIKVAEGSHA